MELADWKPPPELRCIQCQRYLPGDHEVAQIISDTSAGTLCEECYTMQRRRN